MGVCIYPISLLGLSDWLTLLIQVPLGIAICRRLPLSSALTAFQHLDVAVSPPRRGGIIYPRSYNE